jgi:hypothetical protein
MSPHVLPPLAVKSKSERKVNSLPPLGFELVIMGMLAHSLTTRPSPTTQVIGLRILLLTWDGYIANIHKEHSMFSKTQNI